MTVIKQDDLIQSVADALQFISYYHPVDFIQAMHEAYLKEESPAARDSMAQILINSRMCATGHRPICQDTGIVTVFVKVGMDVRWDGATMSVDDMINEGVRRAYNLPENVLRASILADPAGARKNTKDNTPAVIHYSIVPGDKVEVDVAAKGGGSENKSKMAMLNPSDSIVDWVLKTVPTMGAGWCPPGMLGIGIGGTADADAEHAGRAPAGAHGRHGLQHPIDDRVGRVEHGHLRLVLGAAALGRDVHFHLVARDDGVVDHGRGVVLGVLAGTGRVGQDRGAQHVLGQVVGAAYAFVDHVVDAHGGAVPAHVHADLDEYGDDAGVLADRAVAGGTHARVDQDLRHGVAGSRRFFLQVGFVHRLDEVDGVVVGDELQGVGDALDQVVLLDHGHVGRSLVGQELQMPERCRLVLKGAAVYRAGGARDTRWAGAITPHIH